MERYLYSTAEWFLGRYCTSAVISVSKEERTAALELSIPGERIALIPNGIVLPALPSRSETRRRFGLTERDVCLIWVGRLAPQKAPDRFVHLFSMLCKCFPESKALMIGSGPMATDLNRLVGTLQLSDRFQMIQDGDAVLSMPAADIFVMTSRYEGLSYALLEAQAVGLPVVAFEVGGLSAVVTDRDSGFIVGQGMSAASWLR
jgi:glycosyltransferase involved in cell wall biosynthesis